jgi:hypothetical protein
MEKGLTAKEIYLKMVFPTTFENHRDEVELWFETLSDAKQSVEIMIEFAKMHVEAALKEASEKALVYADEGGYSEFVDEQSILNAYPLTNIK